MATKILLADDSMTAQKMGKDILTAAGYEVTAVSNGAAASKKLVDKFDLIILDVYMPGYSGLEVCEKVRANMEIAKTPVLLTVGKMEHYEPADTQRVKADGVIIKPFEATDLLAVVRKLVEKASAASAPKQEKPDYEKTMIFTAPQIQEFKDQSYAEWKTDAPAEAEVAEAPAAPAFEMTHAEASAPAFAMDMAPSVSSFDETVNIPPAPPAATSFDETVGFSPSAPAMDFGTAVAPAFESPAMEAAPGFDMSAPASGFDMAPVPAMPSFEEPVPLPTLEPTVMASVSIAVSLDPHLEVPAPPPEVKYSIPSQDPALASRVEMASEEFITRIGASEPEPETVPDAAADEAAELAAAAAELAGTPAPVAEIDDFEARVAARMSGFESAEPVQAIEAEPEPEPVVAAEPESPTYEDTQKLEAVPDPEPIEVAAVMDEAVGAEPVMEAEPAAESVSESQAPPDGMHDATLVEQMQAAFADLPVETAPHVVEEPIPVAEAPEPVIAMSAPETPAAGGHDLELASALAAAMGGEAPAPEVMAAAAAAPAASGMDPHTIAQVVTRVMERMLPAVMHEIAKELESAKK
ncbi:MAG: response regulator receiver protein [Candidatus Angelobacter sp.]|nr:response regulator receiver protein [Candidatus Angelobacter sp.]